MSNSRKAGSIQWYYQRYVLEQRVSLSRSLHEQNSRTLMSLSAEFERSFSARLNSGLQLLENRLGETLDTSVSTCVSGIGSVLTISYRTRCGSNYLS